MFEVEQKFRVDDLEKIRHDFIERFGGSVSDPVRQSDQYLAHPLRNFGETDEALRIRCITNDSPSADSPSAGIRNRVAITYKGPRLARDSTGADFKTREEIESALVAIDGANEKSAADLKSIFEALGFRALQPVVKQRQTIEAEIDSWSIKIALDQVEGLGSFVEIETVTDECDTEEAQHVIREIANELKLTNPITGSYLEMVGEGV